MTPAEHKELNRAHDHKGVDVFVAPGRAGKLVALLKARGYRKSWARFDWLPSSQGFTCYTKVVEMKGKIAKVILTVFALESLDITGTPVKDLSPVKGIKGLKIIR